MTFILATKYAELVTWVFKYAYIIFIFLILQMYQKCLKTCIVCPFSISLFSPEIQKPSCVFMGYIPARELYTHYLIDMGVVWFLSEFETRSRACVYFNFLNNN